MRIINTTFTPRHVSYASPSPGGRTLKPGDKSPELPITVMHSDIFLKDLNAGKIQITLSKEDNAFLNMIRNSANEPRRDVKAMMKAEQKKKEEKSRKEKEQKKNKKKAKAASRSQAPEPDPKSAGASPDKQGRISLADLAKANAGSPEIDPDKRSSLHEIEKHMRGLT